MDEILQVWDLPLVCTTLGPPGCLNLLGMGLEDWVLDTENAILRERVITNILKQEGVCLLLKKPTLIQGRLNNYQPISNVPP